MHLMPQERDRLLVATAADLARRRLARGARLGAVEAVALIVDEIHEMAWDGCSVESIVERACSILSPHQVLEGVADTIQRIQVDALFPAGTFLVEVSDPVPTEGATHVVDADMADKAGNIQEREGTHPEDAVQLRPGRPRVQMEVINRGHGPVTVTSHADFSQVNAALSHDRVATRRWHLDVPAGSSVRWEPGQTREITLVPFSGRAPVDGAAPSMLPARPSEVSSDE